MTTIALILVIGGFMVIHSIKHPEELSIYSLILSASLPVISKGNLLAIGNKGSNLRLEYLVFLLALFLALVNKKNKQYTMSAFNRIFLPIVLIYQLFSIGIAFYWGMPLGAGIALRFIESIPLYFLFFSFTDRTHIPKLTHQLVGIGFVISLLAFLTYITGNSKLYTALFTYQVDMWDTLLDSSLIIGGNVSRFWLNQADSYLAVVGVMAFCLFLTKTNYKIFYALMTTVFLLRLISSGQRSFTLVMIMGSIVVLILMKVFQHNKGHRKRIFVSFFILVFLIFLLFTFNQSIKEDLEFWRNRLFLTRNLLGTDSQIIGARIAYKELSNKGLVAWLFGFGGTAPSRIGDIIEFDINGILQPIYRYGIIGTSLLFIWAFHEIYSCLKILKHQKLNPEESAVVFGALLISAFYLINVIFRDLLLSDNYQRIAGFIILNSWKEVILFKDIKIEDI